MNEISIFNNQEFGKVRTVLIDNEPWFVGKDMCVAFGDTNYRRSLASLDECDKDVSQINTPGGVQNMTVISESGLYSLLFQMQPQKARGVSQNDEAIEERIEKLHRFKRWITHDVIPSIRKHGMYAVDELLENPDIAIKAFTALKEEREKNKWLEREKRTLEVETIKMDKKISELQPKANYVDRILKSKSTVLASQIANDYGMSATAFNKLLFNLRIQHKVGKQWILYSNHQGNGYVHSGTFEFERKNGTKDVNMNTEWTQKGRLFLYEELKKNGIVPDIEREGR